MVFGFVLSAMIALPAVAAEIITEEDFKQNIIKEEHLVRVADNAIFVFDSSGSMNKKFMDTGKTRIQVIEQEFKRRNAYMPEIGHKFGLYMYSPKWEPLYPVQTYDRVKFAAAIDAIPEEGKGTTPLRKALGETENVLKGLRGQTALFFFTDGTYTHGPEVDRTRKTPAQIAKEWIDKYDLCIYVISTATEKHFQKMLANMTDWNSCSRVVPFANFINRPEYTLGALVDVVATERIVTTTETRIVGIEADNVHFEFNQDGVLPGDYPELNEIGEFLRGKMEAFVVLNGYTDNVGSDE